MNEVVIYPKKIKLLTVGAGSLVFVVFCFYFVLNLRETGILAWVVLLLFYAGILFFGLCFVYAIYRLLSRRPALVISDEGLFDNASAVGAGMLRWEEIAKVFPYEVAGQRLIGIIPVDPEAVIARQPAVKRVMARLNGGMSPAPFNIPQNELPIPIEELYFMILKRRREAG